MGLTEMLTIDFFLAFLEPGKWDFWVFEFLEFNWKDNRRKDFLAKFKMLQRYLEKKTMKLLLNCP